MDPETIKKHIEELADAIDNFTPEKGKAYDSYTQFDSSAHLDKVERLKQIATDEGYTYTENALAVANDVFKLSPIEAFKFMLRVEHTGGAMFRTKSGNMKMLWINKDVTTDRQHAIILVHELAHALCTTDTLFGNLSQKSHEAIAYGVTHIFGKAWDLPYYMDSLLFALYVQRVKGKDLRDASETIVNISGRILSALDTGK